MGFQSVIRSSDNGLQICIWILENHRRMNLFVCIVADTYNCTLANFRKLIEHMLDIFGMNIEPFGRDDRVLLSAAVVQTTFLIHCAEIACVEPSAIVTRRDTFAANKDLPIGRNRHIQPWQCFAKRTPFCVKRMIHRYNGTCFRQAISLNNDKTEFAPEFLQLGINGCAPGYKSPELPTECRVDLAILPQTGQDPA